MTADKNEQLLRAIESLRRDMDSQIAALKAELAEVKAALQAASAAKAEADTPADEIAPELLVIMAAAVTAYLGKKVRIRSAKVVQSPHETVSPWAQHGRVFVQAATYDMRRIR